MKTLFFKYLIAGLMLVGSASFFPACSHEISHEESTNKDWFGNTKHTEDTVTKHPDGSISHEHEEIKVK